ncbi:hypothetical protein KBC75_01395 [Candidatus Shapirobacteria bacterium]|nr:hypothetical protein [Candidatus Shapirobacteria bacterium]
MNLNLGDIVYHKATLKRCVISRIDGNDVYVTTKDGDAKCYSSVELWTEAEYKARE